ncbi:MAG: lipoate--protein ligase family protein [Longimicrobiaceae bacterium]
MAVDAALAGSVDGGGAPVLRFYRWSPACLSFGRHQSADGRYDQDKVRRAGVDVVRRPSGGRAVLHQRELTYSVCLPASRGRPRQLYQSVNRALVRGLRSLGVPVSLAPSLNGSLPKPSLTPCFGDAVPGEVIAAGRKLVGSAQARYQSSILQHGSLLLDGDQSEVHGLLCSPPETLATAPARLSAWLDPLPSWKHLAVALAAGFAGEFGVELVASALSAEESARARELVESRFGNPAWTWQGRVPESTLQPVG